MKHWLKSALSGMGWELRRVPVTPAPNNQDQLVQIGGHTIRFPAQSQIPQAYGFYPAYGRELSSLARLVASKYRDAAMVDVGANVGDTLALIRQSTNAKVYAFEGDATSLRYLGGNAATLGNIEIIDRFLDEAPHVTAASMEKTGWNNTLRPTSEGARVEFTTLDEFFGRHPDAPRIKLVKVDCEGFDARILRGGRQLFSTSRPAVLFEYHARCLRELGEHGPAIFGNFAQIGYTDVVLFDHAGDLLLSTTADNEPLWYQLDRYIQSERSPILYLDAACFHRDDADLARQLSASAPSIKPAL